MKEQALPMVEFKQENLPLPDVAAGLIGEPERLARFLKTNEQLQQAGLSIECLNPEKTSPETFEQLAQTYAGVFAGPPWNEVRRNSATGEFLSTPYALGAPLDGGGYAEEAYPTAETADYIRKEVQKPGGMLFVLKTAPKSSEEKPEFVGFSWGYYLTPQEFAEHKYAGNEEAQQKMLNLLANNDLQQKFLYFSETGIRPKYRGLGATDSFYEYRLAKAKSNTGEADLPVVVRTNEVSPINAAVQRLGFIQIMGRRVGITTSLDGVRKITPTREIVGALDPVREDRVLYMLRTSNTTAKNRPRMAKFPGIVGY